jgi:hypothetical protein
MDNEREVRRYGEKERNRDMKIERSRKTEGQR